MSEHTHSSCFGLTPLNRELELIEPELDELKQFRSLVILIRDQNDIGIKIEFNAFCTYRVTHERYTLDTIPAFTDRRDMHWLYETKRSEFLIHFHDRNPHVSLSWDLKHFLIIMSSDIIDVVAVDAPEISKRTDDIRGWLRAEEIDAGLT